MLAATVAANAQHLDNETFDSNWVKCNPWVGGQKVKTQVGTQPKGWNAANIYGVGGQGKSDKLVTETTGRENTGKAVMIQNVEAGALGITSWAPGYLTLGTPWNTSVGTGKKMVVPLAVLILLINLTLFHFTTNGIKIRKVKLLLLGICGTAHIDKPMYLPTI